VGGGGAVVRKDLYMLGLANLVGLGGKGLDFAIIRAVGQEEKINPTRDKHRKTNKPRHELQT